MLALVLRLACLRILGGIFGAMLRHARGRRTHIWAHHARLGPGSGTGTFYDGPSHIAVGPNGNIYVTDCNNQRVQAFSPDGEAISA